MKTKPIQLFFICGLFISIASCKKSVDSTHVVTEESVNAYFTVYSSSSQPQERPFKGRIDGSFVSTPTADPAIYNSVASATGNVTHFGAFSKVTNDVINIGTSVVEGIFIMTNQSGEQITGRYNGTFSFGITPGTFSWELNATITGGTGKFTYATGEFVFLANGNYTITDGNVVGDYTETFDGTIIY